MDGEEDGDRRRRKEHVLWGWGGGADGLTDGRQRRQSKTEEAVYTSRGLIQ